MSDKMLFKRGDTAIHSFIMPKALYDKGGMVHFMAKAEADNDFEDLKAEISKSFNFGEAEIVEDRAILTLKFEPSDTQNVEFETGETKKSLRGEFEVRTNSGEVFSFPANDKFLKVEVFADIRRGGR